MAHSFEELERMAQNATTSKPTEPTEDEISRWRRLFNYSRLEAISLINAHRSDITRIQIPDGHWVLIKEEREAVGPSVSLILPSLDIPCTSAS